MTTEVFALDLKVEDRIRIGSSIARIHNVTVHRICKKEKCNIKNTVTIGVEEVLTGTRFSLFFPLTMLVTVSRPTE